MAEDMMTEIENEIRNNKVVMYMKGTPASPQCGFSAATTEILQDLGKPFHTVDVLSSPEKRDAIKRFSNWPTIPQVYVNGKFIGGCDIVRELHQRGELQRIVEEAFQE
jgi:monothiol glutaredoxin